MAQDTALRRTLREAGVSYHVVKNTMTRIAAKELGLDDLCDHLEGTTALAVSTDDAVAPAKVICEFMKKNKLEDAGIQTITAGSMQSPIAGTVNVLQGVIRNAVYVLEAIRKQKEEQASA